MKTAYKIANFLEANFDLAVNPYFAALELVHLYHSEAAAMRFLRTVEFASQHGTVAGSAALFLQRLCHPTTVPLDWKANDIDVWLNSPAQGIDLLQAAHEAFPLTQGQEFREYTTFGETVYVRPWEPGTLVHEAGTQFVASMHIGDRIVLKVICQDPKNQPGTPSGQCYCNRNHKECVACDACIRHVVSVDHLSAATTTPDACFYALTWPCNQPHVTFDMLNASVALKRGATGSLCFDNRCDRDPETLYIRPQAMWMVTGPDMTVVERPNMIAHFKKRLCKYKNRGCRSFHLPSTCVIHLPDRSVTMATPTACLDIAASVCGLEAMVGASSV
jgi:hypothetical protein